MKASKNGKAVKALRAINSLSGFFTLLSLIVMLIMVYLQQKTTLYYISGSAFMAFGLILVVTTAVFMMRSIIWHIKAKRLRYLFRHYLYAVLIVYVALIILNHITGGKIGWRNDLLYSPVLAVGSVYLSGYFLSPKKKDS